MEGINEEGVARRLLKVLGFNDVRQVTPKLNEGSISRVEFQDEGAKSGCPLCKGVHDSDNKYCLEYDAGFCRLKRFSGACRPMDLDMGEHLSPATQRLLDLPLGNYTLALYHAESYKQRMEEAGLHYFTVKEGDKYTWYRWMGSHWAEDPNQGMSAFRFLNRGFLKRERESTGLVQQLMSAKGRDGDSITFRVVKSCDDYASVPAIGNLQRELAQQLAIERAEGQEIFDVDDRLLHFLNGFLDLNQLDASTGKFVFHAPDPSKRNRKYVPFDYAETWDEGKMAELQRVFGLWVPDQECRDYLLRYMATTLSGDQDVKAFAVLTDALTADDDHVGNNGKSQCIKYLARTLGYDENGYACVLGSNTFEQSGSSQPNAHTGNISKVPGKRMVYVDEMSKDKKLAKDSLKAWTSGSKDLIPVRDIYKAQSHMRWRAKIFFACNNMQFPRFEDDPALMARMIMVPFENKFTADQALLQRQQQHLQLGQRPRLYPMDEHLAERLDGMRLEFVHLLLGYFRSKGQFVREVTGKKPAKMELYINFLNLEQDEGMRDFLSNSLEAFEPTGNSHQKSRESITLAMLMRAWKDHSQRRGGNRTTTVQYVRKALCTWLRSQGKDPGRVLRVRNTEYQASDNTMPSRVSVWGFRFRPADEEGGGEGGAGGERPLVFQTGSMEEDASAGTHMGAPMFN